MVGIFLISLLSLLYVLYACTAKYLKNNYNLPPGPWFKLPLVGHIPLLGSNPPQALMQWSSTYGPVISIQLGSFPTVVINDGKILKQAFSLASLAGRPKMKMIDDMSHRRGFTFCDGPHAREQRRFVQKTLRDLTNPSDFAEACILEETIDLLQRLNAAKGKPVNVRQLFNRNVINPLLTVLISKKFEPDDPQCDKLVHSVASSLHQRGILPVLGTYIPTLCSYFPSAVGHSIWKNAGKELRRFFRPFLQQHFATAIPGSPRDIMDLFVEKIAASKHDPSSSFHDFRNIEGTFRDILGAAIDTTSCQLEWIVHYMVKYPTIQEKLAEEINSNLPCKRLPSLSDRPKLPYTVAIIQETLRISLIAPLGFFHSALEDTDVAGYHIPKGTLVIGNLYGIHNDPNVWESPREFRPERFITQAGKFSTGDKPVFAFGTGNRSCLGAGLAQNQLFLFTVRIFQSFRVKASGKLCSHPEFSLIVSPKPSPVVFEQRN